MIPSLSRSSSICAAERTKSIIQAAPGQLILSCTQDNGWSKTKTCSDHQAILLFHTRRPCRDKLCRNTCTFHSCDFPWTWLLSRAGNFRRYNDRDRCKNKSFSTCSCHRKLLSRDNYRLSFSMPHCRIVLPFKTPSVYSIYRSRLSNMYPNLFLIRAVLRLGKQYNLCSVARQHYK